MPSQIEPILSSAKVELIVGDSTKPNFGICPKSLDEIAAQTTIIITLYVLFQSILVSKFFLDLETLIIPKCT